MGDRGDEQLRVRRAGRNHRTAERERAALEDPAARREVVGETVDHRLAALNAGGGERPRRAPRIGVGGLRLVDAGGRRKEAREGAGRRGGERAERRLGALHFGERGLPQYRDQREVRRRAQRGEVDVAELAGKRMALPMQFAEPIAQGLETGVVDHAFHLLGAASPPAWT